MKLLKSHQTKMLRVVLLEGNNDVYLVRLYSRKTGLPRDTKILFDDFDARIQFSAVCEYMNSHPKELFDFWQANEARQQKYDRQNAIWRIYSQLLAEIDLDWGGMTPDEEKYFWEKAEGIYAEKERA